MEDEMAKTKQNWINEINSFGKEALGELTQEDLNGMNVGQLKLLKLELEKEANPKTSEPVVEVKVGKFESMCGAEFDPKKSSSCSKQCATDFPEAFKACSEHFKENPFKKKKESKSGSDNVSSGKTLWGHVGKSQAGKIDECILRRVPMSLAEIAGYASAKESRTLDHLKHLVHDWNIPILVKTRKIGDIEEKVYFWPENAEEGGIPLIGKSAWSNK